MKIDSHHHFWEYSLEEYGWISDEMSKLKKDFLPHDLEIAINDCEIDGVISVQARQTLEETDWLLELAKNNDLIKGVVGWLPLAEAELPELLEKYSANPYLKAVRHVIQDEPNENFILGKDFNSGISSLKNYDLTYDILIFNQHLPQTIEFVKQHPEQRFVLDHIAKPNIKANELEPWASNIRELAKFENIWCKVSGMVTEADLDSWTPGQLKPYFENVLEAFGSKRLMYGSDWPVCLLATSYRRWFDWVQIFISELSTDEQADIMGMNAIEAYKLQEQ